MGQVIYDFLLLNKHVVDEDELYDYIADIMDNEFDTIVDDGSMSLLTRRIFLFCKLHLESNEQELRNILDKKRDEVRVADQLTAHQVPVVHPAPPEPADRNEQMEEEDAGPTGDPEKGNGDEDWTLVTRKSNRRI